MYSNHREKSDFRKLYFVALDENKKTIKILDDIT
jgi:hypothetical protein